MVKSNIQQGGLEKNLKSTLGLEWNVACLGLCPVGK